MEQLAVQPTKIQETLPEATVDVVLEEFVELVYVLVVETEDDKTNPETQAVQTVPDVQLLQFAGQKAHEPVAVLAYTGKCLEQVETHYPVLLPTISIKKPVAQVVQVVALEQVLQLAGQATHDKFTKTKPVELQVVQELADVQFKQP